MGDSDLYTVSIPLRIAEVPLEALHNVIIAENDNREILGAIVLEISAGIKKLMTDTRTERNGTEDRMTKKEACAAYTVTLSALI